MAQMARQDIVAVSRTEPTVPHDGDQLIFSMWLHGRGPHTTTAYRRDAGRFLSFLGERGKTLRTATLHDVQDWVDAMPEAWVDRTRARAIAAVKSLIAFAFRTGYLQFDIARPLRSPKIKATLASRILLPHQVKMMIDLEPKARNKLILRTLYLAGLRVSELCGLTWADLQDRGDGTGFMTIYGKGGKTRVILLPAELWADLARNYTRPEDPIFKATRGRKAGKALDPAYVWRIVRNAAKRIGLDNVSPHWLRHAHASHALDNGAPIHLVQATLGHASLATTGLYLHARPNDSSSRYLALSTP